MTFPVTSIYAALTAMLLVVLSIIVSARRGRAGVSILDGGDAGLALWMRRHGNLAENAPIALILMGLCEANGLAPAALHAGGAAFLVFRLAHVVGLSAERVTAPLRLLGGVGTALLMFAAAGWLLWLQCRVVV